MRVYLTADAKQTNWGMLKLGTGEAIAGENITLPILQHYGFTSMPLSDAELTVHRDGANWYSLAEDSKDRPTTLNPGEVMLYVDKDTNILIKPDGTISMTNGEGTFVLGPHGTIVMTNSKGSIDLDSDTGQVDINNGNLTVDA